MKRHYYSIVVFAVLLLTTSQAGLAQRTGTTAYERARTALTGTHRTAFTEIVANARARGLPTEPLADKVLEGIAKRVPPDRIIVVVRQRVDQLARAQTLIRSREAVDVIAVADALQRGVEEATIRQVVADAQAGEPVGLAVHTLADLLNASVPQDVALGMLAGWRGRGAAPAELRELSVAVERLVREGANPGRAGSAIANALRAGRPASTVRMGMELRGGLRLQPDFGGTIRSGSGVTTRPPAGTVLSGTGSGS